MRSTSPLIVRVLQEDAVILGYHVPAGVSSPMINIQWTLHNIIIDLATKDSGQGPNNIVHFEPPKEDNLSTNDTTAEFILSPTCPLFGGSTVYYVDVLKSHLRTPICSHHFLKFACINNSVHGVDLYMLTFIHRPTSGTLYSQLD